MRLPTVFLSLVSVLLVSGCEMLPDDSGPQKKLGGELRFRETTALPPTARAHILLLPATSRTDAKPVAKGDFPAKTGDAIPFSMKFPAGEVMGGEYLVVAQVIDHGKVWYSNLSNPTRVSFVADPGNLIIELRPERR